MIGSDWHAHISWTLVTSCCSLTAPRLPWADRVTNGILTPLTRWSPRKAPFPRVEHIEVAFTVRGTPTRLNFAGARAGDAPPPPTTTTTTSSSNVAGATRQNRAQERSRRQNNSSRTNNNRLLTSTTSHNDAVAVKTAAEPPAGRSWHNFYISQTKRKAPRIGYLRINSCYGIPKW